MSNMDKSIVSTIGGTPLIPIKRLRHPPGIEIFAKLESFNPGGSLKDRAALSMITEAEKKGDLNKDKVILEATSGNTGIGLALVAAVRGYHIVLVMSEAVSEERIKILNALGAELRFTPAHLGTDGAIETVYGLMREEPEKYWLADQFNNEANWKAHYHGTASEIWEQTGGRLDAVVAAMGTTGTVMGISRRFEELDPKVKVVGVEPYLGHKIQGLKNMKESYRPGIFQKERLHRIVHIDDEEAYHTTRVLAKEEGIFVGMSSGAAMAGALRIASELNQGRIVVILPDGGERYLSTPLFTVKKKSGLWLFNTFTRKKEELIPMEDSVVTMYSCGPTLCEFIHVGMCRRLVFSDLIRRYLEYKGYEVKHIVNVTDLDDRTIEKAEKEHMGLKDLTDKYYNAFMEDLEALNIKKAHAYPRAGEHVEDMIKLTGQLVEKGYAYEKFRSVYFDISRYKDYGRLSRIDLDKIRLGKTVDLDQYEKENPRDFTLLKRATLGDLKKGIFFKTQWGNVRPGWHMECSTMAMKYLGPTYDIHTSGVDLIFPHHENTMAISHCLTGKPLANYWVHNEMVTVEGKKATGGSEATSLTLRDLLDEGYSGREIRYWLLGTHYRKTTSFSRHKLDTARKTIDRLNNFVQKVHLCRSGPDEPEMDQIIYDLRYSFKESMDDDLNVAPALAGLFHFVRRINEIIDRKGLSSGDRRKIINALDKINSVLGVVDLEPPGLDEEAKELMEKRQKARDEKDWETADRLRNKLKELGIEVWDTKEGTFWRRERDSNPRWGY